MYIRAPIEYTRTPHFLRKNIRVKVFFFCTHAMSCGRGCASIAAGGDPDLMLRFRVVVVVYALSYIMWSILFQSRSRKRIRRHPYIHTLLSTGDVR